MARCGASRGIGRARLGLSQCLGTGRRVPASRNGLVWPGAEWGVTADWGGSVGRGSVRRNGLVWSGAECHTGSVWHDSVWHVARARPGAFRFVITGGSGVDRFGAACHNGEACCEVASHSGPDRAGVARHNGKAWLELA